VQLLTNNSAKSRFFVEKLKLNGAKCLSTCPSDLPSFIIVDQEQLLFSIKRNNEQNDDVEEKRKKLAALWTNYEAFIKALSALFTGLWSTEMRLKPLR